MEGNGGVTQILSVSYRILLSNVAPKEFTLELLLRPFPPGTRSVSLALGVMGYLVP